MLNLLTIKKDTNSILHAFVDTIGKLRRHADQKFAERDNHIIAAEQATTAAQDAETDALKAVGVADKLENLLGTEVK